jgi:ketosteroid isomerase-like protein
MPDGETTTAEQGIRWTLAALRQALHDRDADAFAALCTDDLRMFDFDPPLQRRGAANEAGQLRAWFANWAGPIDEELHDLAITTAGDVGFTTALAHLRAVGTDGTRTDMWSRATMGFRREQGRWLMAHRHASVPFHMDGSFRAATQLTP